MYYYNARYYDPQIGRFISADTIVPYPTDPQSFNRYSYCRNNPLKFTDPSGHYDGFDETTGEYTGLPGDMVKSPPGYYSSWGKYMDYRANGGNIPYLTFWTISLFAKPLSGNPLDRMRELSDYNQGLFDAFGKINTLPNTQLGNILGTLGNGTVNGGPGGTIIYTNIDPDSPTGKLMAALNGNPITFGYVIITTSPDISDKIMAHELGHVTQYAILGSWFLPLYCIDSIFAGGDWNKKLMEVGPLHPTWPRRIP